MASNLDALPAGHAAPLVAPRAGAHTHIAPAGAWPRIDLGELWKYRALFVFLVWRDVKARYSQTVLGAGWAVLQPLLSMVVFTVIFGRFARIPSDGVPYAAFSFAALVPWTYFSTALTGASSSLVANPSLITKVYFPRLVIPAAPVLAAVVDFVISFVLLLLILAAFRIVPGAETVLVLPVLLGIMMTTAVGVGCWLAALTIQYRDFRHVTPFLLQVWMYASPIVYPLSLVPPAYRGVYALNPMVGVIEGFRSVLLGTSALSWPLIAISATGAAVLLASGVLYYRHMERVFADVA
jgi:lipopolysaccharide transport system permease protein